MGPKRSRVSVSKKPRDILTPEMADRRGGPPSLDTNIFIKTETFNYNNKMNIVICYLRDVKVNHLCLIKIDNKNVIVQFLCFVG